MVEENSGFTAFSMRHWHVANLRAALLALVCLFGVATADEPTQPASIAEILLDVSSWDESLKSDFEALSEMERKAIAALLNERWPSDDAATSDELFHDSSGKTYVMQVVSPTSFLSESFSKSKGELVHFMVEDASTEGLTDDVSTTGLLLMADGTRTFKTALGPQATLKKFTLIDAETVEPVIQRIAEGKGLRVWFSPPSPGKAAFWTLATITRVSGKNVSLQRPGEKKPFIRKLAEFSDSDQEWIGTKENLSSMREAWKAFQAEQRAQK